MKFSIKGVNVLKKKMKKVKNRLNERRLINKKAVILIDSRIQKNFVQEGKLFAGGWKPLAPATIVQRKRNKTGRVRVLQDTGALKTKWEHGYSKKSAMIKSKVDYGQYHDQKDGKGHKLPKRQILPEEKQIMPDLIKLYKGWVRTVIK